jgi:hypothetical protein
VYSPAFVGSAIAICTVRPFVKLTFVLSLEGYLTLFGKMKMDVSSAMASVISSSRSSQNVRVGLACRDTPIMRASTRYNDA